MATARQIEANRENSLRSTGPRTESGKARSRANAIKHGLTGGGVIDSETDAFRARRKSWAAEYRPEGEAANWQMDRLVEASLQLDRCDATLNQALTEHRARAFHAWDSDRRTEAAQIAGGLARKPGWTTRKLQTSWHGCELLVEIWERLEQALEAAGEWSESERGMALDLLGLPPLLRAGRTPLTAPRDTDDLKHLATVVRDEIARHQESMERLAVIDDMERCHAEEGATGLLTKAARLILRYERDAWRHYDDAAHALGRPTPVEAPTKAPVSAPTPPASTFTRADAPVRTASSPRLLDAPPAPAPNGSLSNISIVPRSPEG
jgi:hypothetical protein